MKLGTGPDFFDKYHFIRRTVYGPFTEIDNNTLLNLKLWDVKMKIGACPQLIFDHEDEVPFILGFVVIGVVEIDGSLDNSIL